MSDILNKTIVLVLNRNWQAINIRTPADAFCQMATNVATALEIELGDDARAEALRPVTWDEWITLPVRDGDNAVRTVHGAIRVPTVIVAVNYARVPKKRPKLCARTIRERDGNRCQYTGALLRPDEGSLDHVVPRSRGGPDSARMFRAGSVARLVVNFAAYSVSSLSSNAAAKRRICRSYGALIC